MVSETLVNFLTFSLKNHTTTLRGRGAWLYDFSTTLRDFGAWLYDFQKKNREKEQLGKTEKKIL